MPEDNQLATGRGDAELMSQLRGGSMSALAVLVERHQERVRGLAYRMTGRWDVADDIAQEAFLRLYRAAAQYRPTAQFSTWLYRIVVNLCLDRARRRQPVTLNENLPAGTELVDPVVREECIETVRREVQRLPDRQRTALVLHRYENLSHNDIAEVTGWSESAVESLLVRAYAQLRERLKGWIDM